MSFHTNSINFSAGFNDAEFDKSKLKHFKAKVNEESYQKFFFKCDDINVLLIPDVNYFYEEEETAIQEREVADEL